MELDNSGLFAGMSVIRPKVLATLSECAGPRDPARMDTVEFLQWLDTASEDELRTFGEGARTSDPVIYYDVASRTFFDSHTGLRWFR